MLHALQVFGTNLDDFIHLFLPPVLRLLGSSDSPTNNRRYDTSRFAGIYFIVIYVSVWLKFLDFIAMHCILLVHCL